MRFSRSGRRYEGSGRFGGPRRPQLTELRCRLHRLGEVVAGSPAVPGGGAQGGACVVQRRQDSGLLLVRRPAPVASGGPLVRRPDVPLGDALALRTERHKGMGRGVARAAENVQRMLDRLQSRRDERRALAIKGVLVKALGGRLERERVVGQAGGGVGSWPRACPRADAWSMGAGM